MDDPSEFESAAERELHDRLALVRAHPPKPGTSLLPQVLQTLRWQRLLAAPLTVIATLASGLLGAVRALGGSRRGSG